MARFEQCLLAQYRTVAWAKCAQLLEALPRILFTKSDISVDHLAYAQCRTTQKTFERQLHITAQKRTEVATKEIVKATQEAKQKLHAGQMRKQSPQAR